MATLAAVAAAALRVGGRFRFHRKAPVALEPRACLAEYDRGRRSLTLTAEWVVQNAANSGVGRWVIAFAKTRGLKTVNIVRRPELVAELEAIGGDVVVVDTPDVPERIKAAVGQTELRLALDGVSGPATGVLAAKLSPRGTLAACGKVHEPFERAGGGRVISPTPPWTRRAHVLPRMSSDELPRSARSSMSAAASESG
jgi:NADPH:quinone reductase-like Zn-dependent oxidoreductase